MSIKPIIGVTRCSKLEDYLSSVAQAGGEVRVLEFDENPAHVINQIDGLLLTGGGDVDPALYGERRHSTVHDAEEGRDRFEIDLAQRAMKSDLPTLAICRGTQVLNVASGGTLVQDIPTAVDTALAHSVDKAAEVVHTVAVAPGSRLAQSLGGGLEANNLCRVNSRHHQSVGRVGASFVPSAESEDGVVEAIERPDASFCLGVQWHPENFWRTGEFKSLFDNFVAAAARRLRDKANQ
jgi:putative glutamine amidotransferase